MKSLAATLALLLLNAPAWGLSLDRETTWRGKIDLHEDVRVEAGATLTILPGTVVTFDGGKLEIAGRLLADGARFTGRSWQGIVLKGSDGGTRLTGCTISGAEVGLQAIGGAPRLEKLTLEGNQTGMELRQKTTAAVSGCLFRRNAKVGLFVKDEAMPAVTGCRFEQNGKFGAYIFRSAPVKFAGNRFERNPTGLTISHFGSDPRVAGNRFTGNETAILVDRAARPQLTGNLLRGNGTGIRLYRRADPQVEGNRLEGNKVGISVAYSSYPRLRGNDLEGNGTALLLEFQSSLWEEENGAAAREAESARGAFGQTPQRVVGEAERRPRQLTTAVDARENWWGKEGTRELERLGAEGNPSFIRDGRDTPTFTDGGKSYPLDSALFAPWSPEPLTEGKIP